MESIVPAETVIAQPQEATQVISSARPKDSPTQTRILALDGIRGLAAVMVIWAHYSNIVNPNAWVQRIINVGKFAETGLDLFFVISGFLLAGILLDNKNSPRYYSTFYWRRICRIFPLYFALLGVFTLARLVHPHGDNFFLWGAPLWTFFVFLQNYPMGALGIFTPWCLGPTWSLAVEEQFYLLLPVTMRKLSESQLIKLTLSISVVAILARVAIVLSGETHFLTSYVWTICRMDSLALGVLAALLYRRYRIPEHLLVGIAAALVPVSFLMTYYDTPLVLAFGRTVFAIMYGAIILVITQFPKNFLTKATQIKPLVYLGTLSYGIYLFHVPVRWVVFYVDGVFTRSVHDERSALLTICSVVFTILLSHLSWHIFEKPILKWGQRKNYDGKKNVSSKQKESAQASRALPNAPAEKVSSMGSLEPSFE